MSGDVIGLPFEGEDSYDFEQDGWVVSVRVRERRNGGHVGVYLYGDDGERMEYVRFNIQDVESGSVVAQKDREEMVLPNAVVRALHAGGWRPENLYRSELDVEKDDPLEVQFLDARDVFDSWSKGPESPVLRELYAACARIMEQVMVSTVIEEAVYQSGYDMEDYGELVGENRPYDVSEFDVEDHVEGMILNAVDPSTRTATDHHEAIVEKLEIARSLYRGGMEWDEATKRAGGGGDT